MYAGSGIAPFFPVPAPPSGIYLPFHIFLFVCRVPLLAAVSLTYFVLFAWLPVGSLVKKAALWTILGIPGIWWIDLQIDGVRRGYVHAFQGQQPGRILLRLKYAVVLIWRSRSLAKHQNRVPQPGTVIASSFTSPIDCLYLAAIFDPIFTASYPGIREVQRISLCHAIIRALLSPQLRPPPNARLVSLSKLLKEHPDSAIVVLPECTTTNGRGILPFSPSLLGTPARTKIFPVNLRYTPPDITTPVAGAYLSFLWSLCSKPTHCIRVRIAEAVYNTSENRPGLRQTKQDSYDANIFDSISSVSEEGGDGLVVEERKLLERVGEDLARLGRVKRVGIGVKEKIEFIKVWTKTRKIY
jgi:1-acylglycerol-3-phosphate O-acyltransferase